MNRLIRTILSLLFAVILAAAGAFLLFVLSGPAVSSEVRCGSYGDFRDKNWGLCNRMSGGVDSGLGRVRHLASASAPVIVAVIDTEVDASHPALVGRTIPGWNFTTNTVDTSVKDRSFSGFEHGTHVAGVIAAASPNAVIMPVVYYEGHATGAVNLRRTVAAIDFAVSHGAKIINYSGGGPEFADEEYTALKKAEAKGVLVVAAAGNERANVDLPENYYYPAGYPLTNILTVMSIDIRGNRVSSSNYGKVKVDIAAPGENIYSTIPDGRYGFMTGTSQATPFVTATAAILLGRDLRQTPAEIEERILSHAVKTPALTNMSRSGGYLDAEAVLR